MCLLLRISPQVFSAESSDETLRMTAAEQDFEQDPEESISDIDSYTPELEPLPPSRGSY
jgi:hypothetical protein